MNTTFLNRFGLFALTLTAVILFGASCNNASTANTDPRAEQVAQALTDKGVKYYGAFWCPHCKEQGEMFGEFKSKLPYIECSTPDKRGQLAVCQQAGVTSYPTWVFPGQEPVSGVLSIDELIERADLDIPSPSEPGPIPPS